MPLPDRWLRRRLYALAYPAYECQRCVGQEYWQGCYCDYHSASAPGKGPARWHLMWRWLLAATELR